MGSSKVRAAQRSARKSTGDGGSAERLIDAADTLMYARGYHDVGVAELCGEAGVRPGSFYYYFDSKEALAAAMLDRAWTRTDERIFAAAFDDDGLDVFEAIDRYSELLEANLRSLQDSTGVLVGCRFGNFATESAQHLPLVRAATQAAMEAMTGRFAQLVERGQRHGRIGADAEPDSMATSLLAQMEGLMVIAKATGDPTVIRRLTPAAHRLLASSAAAS
ncbi:MAG: TetR/AcrR family transcriptional regulator [Acidimicrobiales bacterium]